jgi:hypothetical protein
MMAGSCYYSNTSAGYYATTSATTTTSGGNWNYYNDYYTTSTETSSIWVYDYETSATITTTTGGYYYYYPAQPLIARELNPNDPPEMPEWISTPIAHKIVEEKRERDAVRCITTFRFKDNYGYVASIAIADCALVDTPIEEIRLISSTITIA